MDALEYPRTRRRCSLLGASPSLTGKAASCRHTNNRGTQQEMTYRCAKRLLAFSSFAGAFLLFGAPSAPIAEILPTVGDAWADRYACTEITEEQDVRSNCDRLFNNDPCPPGAQCWECSAGDFYSPCGIIINNIGNGSSGTGGGDGDSAGNAGGGSGGGSGQPAEEGSDDQGSDHEDQPDPALVSCENQGGSWNGDWCAFQGEVLGRCYVSWYADPAEDPGAWARGPGQTTYLDIARDQCRFMGGSWEPYE